MALDYQRVPFIIQVLGGKPHMVTRRGLFQACSGLVVAGTASAGVMSPQSTAKDAGWLHPQQALMPEDAHCPLCKKHVAYIRARMAETPAKDSYRTYEIVGLVYYHRGETGVCDVALREI